MKETIHIISFQPINKKRAPKSIHYLCVVSVWMNVIGTFWRAINMHCLTRLTNKLPQWLRKEHVGPKNQRLWEAGILFPLEVHFITGFFCFHAVKMKMPLLPFCLVCEPCYVICPLCNRFEKQVVEDNGLFTNHLAVMGLSVAPA